MEYIDTKVTYALHKLLKGVHEIDTYGNSLLVTKEHKPDELPTWPVEVRVCQCLNFLLMDEAEEILKALRTLRMDVEEQYKTLFLYKQRDALQKSIDSLKHRVVVLEASVNLLQHKGETISKKMWLLNALNDLQIRSRLKI